MIKELNIKELNIKELNNENINNENISLESNGFCLHCGKRLKKAKKQNTKYMSVYHIKCWKEIIKDIKNFSTICYEKYNYKKRICGYTEKEIKEGAKIIVDFE